MSISSWEIDSEYLELTSRLAKVFASNLGFQMAKEYIKGLLSPVERKNGWQLSEAIGKTTPYSLQQFLYRGRFSSEQLREELVGYVNDKLGADDGVVIVDETGFLKQGKMSCGVKRQYSGTAGRVENCQIGVFLTYASDKGYAPIDRKLYIPKDWFEDIKRCRKAGIPETVTFETKPEMALAMIQGATTSGVRYQWVAGDSVYGDYKAIQLWLEEQRKCYVLCVSGKSYVWRGHEQVRVSEITKNLPDDNWFEMSCGDGSKGSRVYDWQVVDINSPPVEDWKRHLLVRRSKENAEDTRVYACFAPTETPIEKFAQIAGTRWMIERCFAEAKSEVGLDQYEVRSYGGWYKHITLACLALALMTVLSSNSCDEMTIQQHNPSSSNLDEFKRGRNLRV